MAVGDIHGSAEGLQSILAASGLVDATGRWTGGDARLIQTGDYTDRGEHVRQVLDTLMRLEGEARRSRGSVEVLMGNHEAMNLLHDFRDVSPASYAAFADGRSEQRRERAYRDYVGVLKARGAAPVPQEAWNAEHPPGFFEYVEALAPRGKYGRWLRDKKTMHLDRGTVFMHAGIADPSAGSLDDVNRRVKSQIEAWDAARDMLVRANLIRPFFTIRETLEAIVAELQRIATAIETQTPAGEHVTQDFVERLQAAAQIGKSVLLDADGPLWFRGYATWPEQDDSKLAALLKHFGASRFVVGHTPQTAITPRFANRVFLIDTGMLTTHYKGGRASALEITGDQFTAIYATGREKIPAATGK